MPEETLSYGWRMMCGRISTPQECYSVESIDGSQSGRKADGIVVEGSRIQMDFKARRRGIPGDQKLERRVLVEVFDAVSLQRDLN